MHYGNFKPINLKIWTKIINFKILNFNIFKLILKLKIQLTTRTLEEIENVNSLIITSEMKSAYSNHTKKPSCPFDMTDKFKELLIPNLHRVFWRIKVSYNLDGKT